MRRVFLLLVLSLLAVGATAQQYPERRQVRKGNRAYERGNYQDAAGRYMRALGADPASFEARYDLGNALHRQELYDQAAQVLQQVAADSLAAPADRAQALYNLGNTQFQQKKYSEALESYKNALRLNPDDLEAKFNYAYVKKLLDDQNRQNQDNKDDKDKDKDNQQNQNGQDQQNPQDNKEDPQNPDQQGADQQQNGNGDDQQKGLPDQPQEGEGEPQPAGISPAEQERMLDAIQAQEDKTQEKLKEKAGAVVRLKKNW